MAKVQSPIKHIYIFMTKPSRSSTLQWDCEPEAYCVL